MSIIFKIQKYLKKRKSTIISIVMIAAIVVSIIFGISSCHYKANLQQEISKTQQDKQVAEQIRSEYEGLKSTITQLETDKVTLNETIQNQQNELDTYKKQVDELQKQINNLTKQNSELSKKLANNITYPDKEYVQATAVWNHLKSLGLNDYVCAGIMGNIMAEVGGQTLDISKWSQYSENHYYGICQWAGSRKDRLLKDYGRTLSDQLEFLSVELFEVIPKNNSFYSMQDEREAALYFAKKYERCGSGSYSVRQTNATKALKYFTGS